MIIYANSRKSGKTTEAIKIAASTHSVLVVSAEDFFNPRNRYGREKESIVVDELDYILEKLFGCEVIMATTTGCMANIEIKQASSLAKEKKLNEYIRETDI